MLDLFRAQIEQGLRVQQASLHHLLDTFAEAAEILISTLQVDNKILACGNGGSAGDAQHIASELVNRFETARRALPAIALVGDSSVVTSIANDSGYEALFARQIEALGRRGDVLIAFSTSGNSPNMVSAIEQAHQQGMRVIACTGKDGGLIAKVLNRHDVELRVPSEETARIQEIHLLIIHALCKAVDEAFTKPRNTSQLKIQYDWTQLAKLTRGLRPLVFTNGVFDILHRGHVHCLEEAARQGAYLVIGVNSDASVKRLNKGADRPIQTGTDRAEILAGLGCVDFVTLFDEDTPRRLIELLQPDVLVKGGDYKIEDIAGAREVLLRGGSVKTIPFEYQRSTSTIVQQVRTTAKEVSS